MATDAMRELNNAIRRSASLLAAERERCCAPPRYELKPSAFYVKCKAEHDALLEQRRELRAKERAA